MTTTLYPFQAEDLAIVDKQMNGRALIGLEMGLGKTIISLFFAALHPEARPMVVVCPAHLKWQWIREASHHIRMRGEILETTKPGKVKIRTNPPLIVVNYEILGQRRGEKVGPGWLGFLKDLKPQIVIVDEIHRCKDPSSLACKSVKSLCDGVPYVLGLSGTPIENRPAELWPIFNIIKPTLFPSRWNFLHKFCAAKKTYWGWDFSGSSNLDILSESIKCCTVRRRTEDVLKDLPPITRMIIPIPLSDRKEYNHAINDFIGWLEQTSPERVKSAERATALVKFEYIKQLITKLKRKGILGWFDSFLEDTDQKIIVFGTHTEPVEFLHKHYKNSTIITGKVTGKARENAKNGFLKNKKTRFLFGNLKAAGEGWSAKGVPYVAFHEMGWTPGSHAQAEARAHGLFRGSETIPTVAYYLLGEGTIEEDIFELIQKKARISSTVMDGGKGENFDVVVELTERIRRKGKK